MLVSHCSCCDIDDQRKMRSDSSHITNWFNMEQSVLVSRGEEIIIKNETPPLNVPKSTSKCLKWVTFYFKSQKDGSEAALVLVQ